MLLLELVTAHVYILLDNAARGQECERLLCVNDDIHTLHFLTFFTPSLVSLQQISPTLLLL